MFELTPSTLLVPTPMRCHVPMLIDRAGGHVRERFIEFFAARIRNEHTRRSYMTAANLFLDWCDSHGLALESLTPTIVATYVELLSRQKAAPTVKQHLAALKMVFDYLVVTQVLGANPCHAVKGPRYSIARGKTPVLTAAQARHLLDSIETSSLIGLRDRALIGVMVYSFARIGAVVGMDVGDIIENGRRWSLRLREKNGKDYLVPCHRQAEEYLDAYLTVAGIAGDGRSPLFRTIAGKRGTRTEHRMDRRDALAMVKRRAALAGLPSNTCCHTFRATGITTYLLNGGTIDHAQTIAAHSSTSTTKLYDRRSEAIAMDEIERISI